MIDVKDIQVWSDPSTIEVDGRTYTYRSEVDECHSVMDDGDWYGTMEWKRTQGRPDGFDGNAEILKRDWYDTLWWQPPSDVKRGTEMFSNLRSVLCDALEHGYAGVVVEGPDGTSDSVWGFVWSDDAGMAEAVVDLITGLHAAYLADRATWADSFI